MRGFVHDEPPKKSPQPNRIRSAFWWSGRRSAVFVSTRQAVCREAAGCFVLHNAIMKAFILISLVTLTVGLFPRQGHAQSTSAPLFVFTNGSGSITPLQNGQLLQVGQNYEMTATPGPSYSFESWQPVNVSVFTTIYLDNQGNTVTNTSVVTEPQAQYYSQPVLDFTMQPQVTLVSNASQVTTANSGWQANFVPVFSLQINSVTNSQCTMTLTSPPDFNYTIEMTTDLISGNWTDIASVSTTNGICTFTDINATNNCQFYRAVMQ